MTSLGGTVYYGPTHRTCPKDMALYAKELFNFNKSDPGIVGEMVNNLEHTIFNDRINALLPKGVAVAHKIGNYNRVANDVGIVFAKHPYILSVFSDDVDFGNACTAIAKMSKLIYDYVISQ